MDECLAQHDARWSPVLPVAYLVYRRAPRGGTELLSFDGETLP